MGNASLGGHPPAFPPTPQSRRWVAMVVLHMHKGMLLNLTGKGLAWHGMLFLSRRLCRVWAPPGPIIGSAVVAFLSPCGVYAGCASGKQKNSNNLAGVAVCSESQVIPASTVTARLGTWPVVNNEVASLAGGPKDRELEGRGLGLTYFLAAREPGDVGFVRRADA